MKALLLAAAWVLLAPGESVAQSAGSSAKQPAARAGGDSAAINALLERADAGRIQGSRTATVWLVEVSDFQCPFCKRWHDEVYPAIQREFITPGLVRMAYVNLPLSHHRHAAPAAEAALCASAQGRFWPLHDKLFATQERWTPLDNAERMFDSLAVASGVDAAMWRGCMRSGLMKRVINGDKARAAVSGVRSTPTFFVGDEPIEGVATIAEFRAAIARARARAGGRPPQ